MPPGSNQLPYGSDLLRRGSLARIQRYFHLTVFQQSLIQEPSRFHPVNRLTWAHSADGLPGAVHDAAWITRR